MTKKIIHKFVETIPDKIENGIVYISVEYTAVVHKCFCGCGNEVNTPLSPTDWKITFNGESISLYPSIGNWNLTCQSHYWIKNNNVHYADKWSKEDVAYAKAKDTAVKAKHYSDKDADDKMAAYQEPSLLSKFRKWFLRTIE